MLCSVPALEAFADATLTACGIAAADTTVYRFSVKDRKGADVPLEQYMGKVLLVVGKAAVKPIKVPRKPVAEVLKTA